MKIKDNKINIQIKYLLFFLFLYLTIFVGYYFNEDNLGGAIHDSTYHFKISEKFNQNFYQTFSDFGGSEVGMSSRNSPIFWIFLSLLDKFFSYDTIRTLNTVVILFTGVVFYKCLLLKFQNTTTINLFILSSFIFLSPSLRSLAIWPYSLAWGLLFFVVSIYYYLKFNNNFTFKNSCIILFFLILSSYIYPSFSVFYLFYIFEIFKQNKKIIFGLMVFSLILSIPCIIYLLTRDFLGSFDRAQGAEVSLSNSLNISNKILIISTMFFYFVMPIINLKEVISRIKIQKLSTLILILIFCIINIYFFNFPNANWGGGFFHKLSNVLFSNNYAFFLAAFFSLTIIYCIVEKSPSNYLLLIILIMYNPQLTIYIKYFDPLIFIIFLTLFDFNFKKHFIDKAYSYYQFYGVILFYYLAIYTNKILI